MNRSTLIGLSLVAVLGTGLALVAVWNSRTPKVVDVVDAPDPAPSTMAGQPSAPPGVPAELPPPESLDRREDPDRKPIERRPDPLARHFKGTEARFESLAHQPVFERISPELSPEATAEATEELLSEVQLFEDQMRQIAEVSPPEIAREAYNRAAIVYDRVAGELPPRPPDGLDEAELQSWHEALDARRVRLHERARDLQDEMNRL